MAEPFIVLSAEDLYSLLLTDIPSSRAVLDIPSGPVPYSGGRSGPTLAVDMAPRAPFATGGNGRFGPNDTYMQGDFNRGLVDPFVQEHIVEKGSGGVILCIKGCDLSLSVAEYYISLLKRGVRGLDLLLVPCCMISQRSWGGTLESVARSLSRKLRDDLAGVGVNVEVQKVMSKGRMVKDVWLVKAYGMIDDFWSCAFAQPPPPHWLVPTPGTLDGQPPPFAPSACDESEGRRLTYSFCGLAHSFCSNFSDGVLNDVGLEPWDAGYVLLALLKSLGDSLGGWDNKRVLEVGSGCGFVGLGLKQGLKCRDMVCTDFDEGVLGLLRSNVEHVGVSVAKLDWFEYTEDMKEGVFREAFDIVVGSEVVYTPDHAVLSKVISAALRQDGIAIIVNYNRPGWDQFCRNAEHDTSLEDVSTRAVDVDILEEAEVIKGEQTTGGEKYQILTARRGRRAKVSQVK